MQEEKLLSMRQVSARVGLCRVTIYKYIKAGNFPKPKKPNGRELKFLNSEIEEWINGIPDADVASGIAQTST